MTKKIDDDARPVTLTVGDLKRALREVLAEHRARDAADVVSRLANIETILVQLRDSGRAKVRAGTGRQRANHKRLRDEVLAKNPPTAQQLAAARRFLEK